jgi:glycosyltransferase involved in cell wall biosynthesis
MIIAVDTRLFSKNTNHPELSFLSALVIHLAQQHPGESFIFLFDRPYSNRISFPPNVTPVVIRPAANHLLTTKYWYDFALPRILRKHQADVLLCLSEVCSMRTRIPQCLVIHSATYFTKDNGGPFFRKRLLTLSLKKSTQIITFSGYLSERLLQIDHSLAVKTKVIQAGAPVITGHIDVERKWAVRDRFTSGKQFFLYTGPLNAEPYLINLLKAFSVFKKRQKSDWKLVMAGWHSTSEKSIAGQLSTYKHRADVVMMDIDEVDIAALQSAAYALVYPVEKDGMGIPIISAFKFGLPVIAAGAGAQQEIAGDAAIYVDANDHQDIAQQMMRLYKDEALRGHLIAGGRKVAERYTMDTSARLFWQSILAVIR